MVKAGIVQTMTSSMPKPKRSLYNDILSISLFPRLRGQKWGHNLGAWQKFINLFPEEFQPCRLKEKVSLQNIGLNSHLFFLHGNFNHKGTEHFRELKLNHHSTRGSWNKPTLYSEIEIGIWGFLYEGDPPTCMVK